MIKLTYHSNFIKRAKRIPRAAYKKLTKQLSQLRQNPFYSTLHTKRLSGALTGMLSFRVTRDWRVVFQFIDEETILLVDVGHRSDVCE